MITAPKAEVLQGTLDLLILQTLVLGAAHRKLGNPTLIREEIYHMNSLGWLETLWQDLRYHTVIRAAFAVT